MGALIRPHASRRGLILAGGALALASRARGAARLGLTPEQTEGPFYPSELPRDTDADLVRVTGADAQALGQVTHLMGRVLDRQGRPLAGAFVEIWQCDANGRYLHPDDGGRRPRDPRFQGYGRMLTATGGGYRFRTIRPVAYTGRTPHIHLKVLDGQGGAELLTTQIYVAGEPLNLRDGIYRRLEPEERERVTVALQSAAGIEEGALAGTCEIVVDA